MTQCLITPNRGKRIFAILLILIGVGAIGGILNEESQSRFRTSITEANVLESRQIMSGIGPIRQYSRDVKYEFYVEGVRFEKQQLVDQLPSGKIYVRFDPDQPKNNGLDLPNSSPQVVGVFAGALILIGALLAWHSWKPLAFWPSTYGKKNLGP